MKKLYISSWILFSTGVVFMFLHYPGNALLMIAGCFLLITHGLRHLFINAKGNLPVSLVYLSISFLTIWVVSRIMFWGISMPLLYISNLLTISCLLMHVFKNIQFKKPQIVLICYFIFSIFFAYIPSHQILYLFRLNTVLNGERRNLDYRSWDKYSWFLYRHKMNAEALNANSKAKAAVSDYLKINSDKEVAGFAKNIDRHKQQIKDKNWTEYP